MSKSPSEIIDIKRECLLCNRELSKKQKRFCSRSCNASYYNSKMQGEYARNWKGGRCYNSEGYVRIYLPDHPNACYKYVYEHRYIVEQDIGRMLKTEEIVHHQNGKKDYNEIENLHLYSSQSEHCKTHNELSKV